MNSEAIKAHLPHRYPFLLVDRVLEREPGVRVVAEKLLTINEPYFQGHFADRPLLPGVLMLEMLAQAGGFLECESLAGKNIFLAQVLDARFKGSAFPGDKLRLEVSPDAAFGNLCRINGTVSCEGRVLCTAKLLLMNAAGPEGPSHERGGPPGHSAPSTPTEQLLAQLPARKLAEVGTLPSCTPPNDRAKPGHHVV